jgi:hypothetical protein
MYRRESRRIKEIVIMTATTLASVEVGSKILMGWTWWYTSVIPVYRRLRQEDCQF